MNGKRIGLILCAVMILLLAGCMREEATRKTIHDGAATNAVILNIGEEVKTITVKDADSEGVFGDHCTLNCADASFVYCDYETGEVWSIELSDLSQGDVVNVLISASEIQNAEKGSAKITQLQLCTQRLKK